MEINNTLLQNYLVNYDSCIVCNSRDVIPGETYDGINNQKYIDQECKKCNSTWTNVYKPYNVENLKVVSDKIVYVKGDATQPITLPCIIAHIVNDQGGWGAGFTGAITRQFGIDPREHYKRIQRSQAAKGNRSGYCFIWEGPIKIMHMVAQRGYQSLDNPHPLHLGDLDKCLAILYNQAKGFNLSIHMPKIGTGLGGASWNEILPIIEKYRNGISTFVYAL